MIRRRATSQSGAPSGRPRHPSPAMRGPTDRRPATWAQILWGVTFVVVGSMLIWVLRPVLAVLAASAGIAYILDPMVDWCERHGLSREKGIGLVFTSLLLIVALTVLLLIPSFTRQFDTMLTQIAPSLQNLDERIAPSLAWVSEKLGREVTLDFESLQQAAPAWIAEQWPKVQDKAVAVMRGLFTQGLGVVSAILNLTLLPIFVFYMLRDWDKLVASIHDLVPFRFRPRVQRVAAEVDQRLGAFIRGQITVALALAVLYSIGLLLVGIDLAIPVGVMSGLLFIVPYLGTAVGVVLGTLLALVKFGFGYHILAVVAVFVVVQLIEGSLLTPKIVGDKVGLHPLVVMVALIVGCSLMGIWGMLLAIPITAVLSCLAAEWLATYRASAVYGSDEPS